MTSCNCPCKSNCALIAVIISAILGVVAAFLQISGVITVTTAFLWVTLGIAVVYLGLLVATTMSRRNGALNCLCSGLNAVLAGILGTILFALVLLAVGITATSILSAVLVGLLIAFLTLIFTASACLVRCVTDCDD